MSRLGLNEVKAESYLAILLAQSLIAQSNGKYVVTQKGQGYLLPASEQEKSSRSKYWLTCFSLGCFSRSHVLQQV